MPRGSPKGRVGMIFVGGDNGTMESLRETVIRRTHSFRHPGRASAQHKHRAAGEFKVNPALCVGTSYESFPIRGARYMIPSSFSTRSL